MDKVTVEFKIPEKKTIVYKGVSIEIIHSLALAHQAVLINRYMGDYFGKSDKPLIPLSDYNYIPAEFNLFNYILQGCTNIDVETLNNDAYVDPEFVERITSEIVNYNDFRYRLENIVGEVKEQLVLANSLGTVISDLVNRAEPLLKSLAEITPEQIESTKKAGLELADKLKESSVLGEDALKQQVEVKAQQ